MIGDECTEQGHEVGDGETKDGIEPNLSARVRKAVGHWQAWVCPKEIDIVPLGGLHICRPPLRGYVGQRRPHKLIITGQRDDIASQWVAPDDFDPMSPRHPEERGID
jgi:hypothetical protein